MSLIQRAVQESGSILVARRASQPRREVTGEGRAGTALARSFNLDFRRLAGEGLIVPGILDSRLAGQFGAIKRRLLQRVMFFPTGEDANAEGTGTIVIVTSALAGEGKTFTTANLALSLALEDRIGVVLIDADFARSRLCSVMGLGGQPGITDRLNEPGLRIEDLLQQAVDLPLCVLPTGSRRMSTAQIFSDDRFGLLLDDVARMFPNHLILIDSPPLLATTEANVLARHASQILLVVEAGRTTRDSIAEALELLSADTKVSLVLNRSFGRNRASHRYYGSYYQPGDQIAADNSIDRH